MKELKQGVDVVSGWRRNRRDYLLRVLISRVANFIISRISGLSIHDLGCTLKAYKREVLREIPFFGDAHRFLPVLAHWQGFIVKEVVVEHHPRRYGRSKYGLLPRMFKVSMDILFLSFLFARSPIRFFGITAFVLIVAGLLVLGFVLYQKFALNIWVHKNPLFIIGIVILVSALQIMMTGVIAELVSRNYLLSLNKKPYRIEKIVVKP